MVGSLLHCHSRLLRLGLAAERLVRVQGLRLGGTPEQGLGLANMMNSPVMQSMLQNPEVIQNMMASNPAIRQARPDTSGSGACCSAGATL